MPTSPWRAVHPADPASTAVVIASRFRVRGLRHVPRFFLDAMRIHRQVRGADGVLGVSLIAHPLRREFLTLSAWRDRAALDAMVRTDPHLAAMRRHRPVMADSAFAFWRAPAGELPVDWDEAHRRLDAETTSG